MIRLHMSMAMEQEPPRRLDAGALADIAEKFDRFDARRMSRLLEHIAAVEAELAALKDKS